ncbi:hypothetical protein FTO74_14430 [Granulicella sp. WH15]|uniref:hypothetical protein n=1 Tax=Granulicella sp. WH15 TaxID=2602070 RepID=UPI0013671A63|nr:hypothetical protein [Granulicella sp. WH15]QHN04429.1 hypothetical protein FTO74_14430 [Granulicella sp. WH15]
MQATIQSAEMAVAQCDRPILVERDAEGLQLALRALFEEALILHRMDSILRLADKATRDRAAEELPERELSPGYYRRAAYLLELSTTLELGVPVDPSTITRSDVIGLQAVRNARQEYEYDHPACEACGERQDNRFLKQCFKCATKFAGRGN